MMQSKVRHNELAVMVGLLLSSCTASSEGTVPGTTSSGETSTSSDDNTSGGEVASSTTQTPQGSTTDGSDTGGSTGTTTDPTTGDSTDTSATDGSETSSGSDTQGGSTTGNEDCLVATISGPLMLDPGPMASYRAVGEFTDAAGVDTFLLQFFAPDVGLFDLAAGLNNNFATCEQCIVFREDDQVPPGPRYFQSEGSLELDRASAPFGGSITASLVGVTLVESTFDPDSTPPFVSTPVPGGGCFVIEDVTLSTP